MNIENVHDLLIAHTYVYACYENINLFLELNNEEFNYNECLQYQQF